MKRKILSLETLTLQMGRSKEQPSSSDYRFAIENDRWNSRFSHESPGDAS